MEGSDVPGRVTTQRFDFDHICAEIPKDPAAKDAGIIGEVEDSIIR